MRCRPILILSCVQVLLAVLIGAGWYRSFAWQSAAVYDMADQLVLDGFIPAEQAARFRTESGSIGAYLQQGWDRRVFCWGIALVTVATIGPLVTGFLSRRCQHTVAPPRAKDSSRPEQEPYD